MPDGHAVHESRKPAGRAAAPKGDPGDLSVQLPRVLALGEKYAYDAPHAAQVASLAGQLFTALADLHGLPPSYRDIVEHAGLLHDIGYFVNPRRHHRHSAALIRGDALLDGYPEPWRELVALVARNHRRRPRPGPRAWGRRLRATALMLSALLRIADGLDYAHDGQCRLARVDVGAASVRLELGGVRLPALRRVITRKAAVFPQVFGRDLSIVAADAEARHARRRLTADRRS